MTANSTTCIVAAFAVALVAPGCDSGAEETPAESPASNAAGESAPQPEAEPVGGPPVLEAAEIPNIGTVQMPRGYTTTRETATSGNYAYDLGDFASLQLSWESGAGAADLAAARRAAGYMAGGEVQEAQTLDNGMHEVITLRERDGRSFVLVIAEDRYIKCNGPSEHLEVLRSMCQSAPVPAG